MALVGALSIALGLRMFLPVTARVDVSNFCFVGRPRCPQVDIDVRHLLRIPEDFVIEQEPEDEFECLTVDITCPPDSKNKGNLPVLVWIHGMRSGGLVQ